MARAAESSRTTHGAQECLDACRLLSLLICRALEGCDREALFTGAEEAIGPPALSPKISAIASGQWREKSISDIRGAGYVVDSLEAALWCFERTTSFREAVLMAANLGDDADTTAAVCGQVAGAYYGVGGIPEGWLELLAMREVGEELADGLLDRRENRGKRENPGIT